MTAVFQTPTSTRVMNLAYWSTHNARRLSDHVAFVWGDKSWTWAEFDARVSAFAAALAERGVGPGSTVLVHSKNSNEMFESMFATFRLGAIWVPTNFRLMPDEVVYIASKAKSQVFLCQSDFPEYAAAVCKAQPRTQVIWLTGAELPRDGGLHAAELVEAGLGCTVPNAAVDRDTPCWFLFTSGTTGKPKAAVLTHGQMAFVVNNHLSDLLPGTDYRDGSLVVAPLSHGAGVHQLIMASRGGKTVLLPSEKFSADQAFELIEKYRLTNMFTVPTILKMLVEHPSVDLRDHSSLRYVVYAGAPMYEVDKKLALDKLGPVLVQYYGLGEVTGNITVLPPQEHCGEGAVARAGTCGYERTGIEVSVQDDDGNELAYGETGEICVVGPAVFLGYYDDPAANAKAFRNGWFRTGDLGYMDHDGYVYLTGRHSDMYISGGSNIYPRELEEKILTHEDVAEVAVLGLPDHQWGEVGVAVCVLRPGATLNEERLLDWMSTRIARYKIPKRVYFWEELPKSGYGKVPKRLVKDELARRGVSVELEIVKEKSDASH
ncbi:acyl-CoA synthetase [Burkholderia sp. Bp8998]|uniref:acyl-CoA synthetase n=1 Tax=Burkholderia sp. Bp8998 TaxID=2184557 RepID=UPI000F58FD3A|nr:acyl-CoA synthetase [Burkholderia sp. Bp8998]RQS05772.1 acyl-CoA synthetase [Burkholderia sp. Bp8998]